MHRSTATPQASLAVGAFTFSKGVSESHQHCQTPSTPFAQWVYRSCRYATTTSPESPGWRQVYDREQSVGLKLALPPSRSHSTSPSEPSSIPSAHTSRLTEQLDSGGNETFT